LVEILPPFNAKVPAIVGVVAKDNAPVVNVKLLKVIAPEPFTVPAFANTTVPVPLVNVPLLVKVPLALMFKVAAAPQLNVPPFTKLPTVIEPDAPVNVNTPVPTVVIALVTVPMATVALAVAVIPVLTVIEAIGEFVKAAAILKLCAMVEALFAVGTTPPNHEEVAFQFDAPEVVINPR
jgi:hypothetical protein